ncbi:MAG: hypothetical protein LUO93_00720 [Methanomicrobiales archaeon]|nr:hypothetical protein [Methanomicrobiales archaeon]
MDSPDDHKRRPGETAEAYAMRRRARRPGESADAYERRIAHMDRKLANQRRRRGLPESPVMGVADDVSTYVAGDNNVVDGVNSVDHVDDEEAFYQKLFYSHINPADSRMSPSVSDHGDTAVTPVSPPGVRGKGEAFHPLTQVTPGGGRSMATKKSEVSPPSSAASEARFLELEDRVAALEEGLKKAMAILIRGVAQIPVHVVVKRDAETSETQRGDIGDTGVTDSNADVAGDTSDATPEPDPDPLLVPPVALGDAWGPAPSPELGVAPVGLLRPEDAPLAADLAKGFLATLAEGRGEDPRRLVEDVPERGLVFLVETWRQAERSVMATQGGATEREAATLWMHWVLCYCNESAQPRSAEAFGLSVHSYIRKRLANYMRLWDLHGMRVHWERKRESLPVADGSDLGG